MRSSRSCRCLSMKPRTIKKTLPEAPNCSAVKLDDARITRAVCVQLIISTAVSFRSVPKILQSMGAFYGAPSWVPHFSSVINWTQRVGLALLKQVAPIDDPWLAIVDHSIDIGVKQAFVVLRVRCDVLAERGAAIRLEDCECIGLRIRESTDGETVCEDLKDIFKQSGDPVGFIKDNGGGLSRGIRLWNEEAAKPAEIIDDVGHVMANALKAEFDKTSSCFDKRSPQALPGFDKPHSLFSFHPRSEPRGDSRASADWLPGPGKYYVSCRQAVMIRKGTPWRSCTRRCRIFSSSSPLLSVLRGLSTLFINSGSRSRVRA
jgi:hypothetical protein